MLFGLTLLTSSLRFLAYGWIDDLFVKPQFHFKYWGFAWVEVLPSAELHALYWVLAGLAMLVSVGLLFRWAAAGLCIGFGYLQLLDVTTYLNHYYLAALLALLLAVSPAGRSFSVDTWLWPKLRRSTVSASWLYLFRFQVAVVYTFAGLAKAHGDWLFYATPLRIWLISRTETPLIGPLLAQAWAAPLMSWCGFLFDTSIPWLMMNRRLRPFAYALVIGFHSLTGLLFPIGMFPVIMILSALVFFSPSWPRKLWSWLTRSTPPVALPETTVRAATRWQRVGFGVAALYCLVQLLVPARFMAYGGSVRWHEQGMRFSWRVMVREKNGSVTFVVRVPSTGRTLHIAPHRYLTPLQEREMSSQPDLILQLAHHIRDEYEQRGQGPVEVRVDAWASLNGRAMRRLIDPSVDLSRIEDGIGKASWILPEPTEPPPLLHAIRI